MNAGGLMAATLLAAIGLGVALSRRKPTPAPAELDAELGLRHGPLYGGLTWSQVVWVRDAHGTDLWPTEDHAQKLRSLSAHVLAPAQVPGLQVVEGYRRSAALQTCPFSGHNDGRALCVRADGWTPAQLATAIYMAGVPVGRLIVHGDRLHVDIVERGHGIQVRTHDGKTVPIRTV